MAIHEITPIALGNITSREAGIVSIGNMDLNLTGARELMARLALALEAAERADNEGPWAQLSHRLDQDYERVRVVQYRDVDARTTSEGSLCRVQGDRSMQPRIRIGKFLTANLTKRKDRWVGHVTRWHCPFLLQILSRPLTRVKVTREEYLPSFLRLRSCRLRSPPSHRALPCGVRPYRPIRPH